MALIRLAVAPAADGDRDAPGGRRRLMLLAMAAASGAATYPTAAIAIALPTLHDQLNASLTELQWSVTLFTLAFAAFLVTAGRLADVLGRRRVVCAGALILAAGSALSALASSALLLIAGLAIAGVGAAALVPASLAIIVNAYPPAERGLPIGVWGAASTLAQSAAPILGGFLITELSWRFIFWLPVVLGLAIVALTLVSTLETRDERAERHLDVLGVALAAGALGSLMLAIIQGPVWGWSSAPTLTLFGASVALSLGFAIVESRTRAPVVEFALFRSRNFSGATAGLFALNFAFIAALFFLPLYLQELLGRTPAEAGVLLLPLTAAIAIAMPLGGRLAERIGPLPPLSVGLAMMAIALWLISDIDASSRTTDLIPMVVLGIGYALAITPMNLAAMNAVPPRKSGSASGLFGTLSVVGISLGVAVTGAVFNAIQLDRTASLAAERGVALPGSQAKTLDGLLAGASDAQQALQTFAAPQRAVIEEAVREAFADGVRGALLLAAIVTVAGLVVALALIRNRPAVTDEPA